jgi:parallel beta-helix repeat protein
MVNASVDNIVSGNRVYDNRESGIGVGQTAEVTLVENTQIRGNQQDGVRLVSEAMHTTVRGNVIGEMPATASTSTASASSTSPKTPPSANRTGVMLRSAPAES